MSREQVLRDEIDRIIAEIEGGILMSKLEELLMELLSKKVLLICRFGLLLHGIRSLIQ